MKQKTPTAAVDAAELDDANGITPADVTVTGTVAFNQAPAIGTAFLRIPGLVGGATAWVTARNDIPSADGTNVITSGVTAGTCP